MSTENRDLRFWTTFRTLLVSVPGPLFLVWAGTWFVQAVLIWQISKLTAQDLGLLLAIVVGLWLLEGFKESLYKPMSTPGRLNLSEVLSSALPRLLPVMMTQLQVTTLVVVASLLMGLMGVSVALIPMIFLSLFLEPATFVAATQGVRGTKAVYNGLELIYRQWKLTLCVPAIFVVLGPLFELSYVDHTSIALLPSGEGTLLEEIRSLAVLIGFLYLKWIALGSAYLTAWKAQDRGTSASF